MALIDFLVDQVNKDGWLSLSTLYFDNYGVLNVYTSDGFVAYSPSKELFFNYGVIDSADTQIVENTFVRMENKYVGLQRNITVYGLEHLQHYDLAGYTHDWPFYDLEYEKLPQIKIPTPAELKALTKDPETGLYPGTDTVVKMDMNKISTISMYDKPWPYSGAIIDNWKKFYENQEKFKVLLAERYGVTDCI